MTTKTAAVAATVATVVAGAMVAIKDEQGKTIRSFPLSNWTPKGGYPRPEVRSTEVIFTADEEGSADQITFIDVEDKKQAARKAKLADFPHADPTTLFYSAKAQKFGVLIRCIESGESRRVWTSDLHQVQRSEKVQAAYRREKAKAKRKDKAAEKAAATPVKA